MSLNAALSNAVSGMNASTLDTQVKSTNIANEGVEGYQRREVVRTTDATGGVTISSVSVANDPVLQADRLSADAEAADAAVRSDAVNSYNSAFGEPGDANSINGAVTAYETALEDLATTPESAANQQQVVDTANALTKEINDLSEEVTEMRSDADKAIADTVDDVNAALRALEDLNNAARAQNDAAAFSNVPEQQQQHINTIAEAMEIEVRYQDDGRVQIWTAEGVQLLGEEAQQIEFTQASVVPADATLAGGQLSGISVNGIDLTPGGGAQSIGSGSLAGNFAVRDDIGVEYNNQIDALAADLIDRYSGPTADTTLSAGEEGLFVSNGGTGAGVAGRISVNAAVDPDQGGDLYKVQDGINATAPSGSSAAGQSQNYLDALYAERDMSAATQTATAMSFIDATAEIGSLIGTDVVRLDSEAAATASTAESLRLEEAAYSAVDIDSELEDLLAIENAYAANAEVVRVVNEMLSTLLEIV